MSITLYHVPWSPPSRFVRLVGRAVGATFRLVTCDPLQLQHVHPDFLQLNPMHTVPTIEHEDEQAPGGRVVLWESRAIAHYLVGKFAPHSPLIPTDVRRRAVYDQRLFFDFSLLHNLSQYARTAVFSGVWQDNASALQKCLDSFEMLDYFLQSSRYVAGDQISLIDYSAAASVSTCGAFERQMSLRQYPAVAAWMQRVSAEIVDFNEINGPGVAMMKQLVEKAMGGSAK